MVERYLFCSTGAVFDDASVRRICQSDFQVDEPLERSEVVTQDVASLTVHHDDGGDPGEYMVAGEQNPGLSVSGTPCRRASPRIDSANAAVSL